MILWLYSTGTVCYDVHLSHLNKDYLLTYLLTYLLDTSVGFRSSQPAGDWSHKPGGIGRRYFPPMPRLPPQPGSINALWLVQIILLGDGDTWLWTPLHRCLQLRAYVTEQYNLVPVMLPPRLPDPQSITRSLDLSVIHFTILVKLELHELYYHLYLFEPKFRKVGRIN